MATQPKQAQRKHRGTGFDLSARQGRMREQEGRRAESRRDGERRDEAVGAYLKHLSSKYLAANPVEEDGEQTNKGNGKRRPTPIAFAGSGLQRRGAVQAEGLEYRSNEEALPSRHDGKRNRSPKAKKSVAKRVQPEYNATAAEFGPSLGTAKPRPPAIWGAGMPPPQAPPKMEPIQETQPETKKEEVQEGGGGGYAAAAAAPPPVPAAPTHTPATPPPPANDVWGDEDSDDDEDVNFAELKPGQAWGTAE